MRKWHIAVFCGLIVVCAALSQQPAAIPTLGNFASSISAIVAGGAATITAKTTSSGNASFIADTNASSGITSFNFYEAGTQLAYAGMRGTTNGIPNTIDIGTLTAGGALRLLYGAGSAGLTISSTGIVTVANIITTPVAVASLSTCNSGNEGMHAFVNNSNATSFTLGIGAIVAAGGTTHVPVICDGTNWRIG